MAGRAFDGIGLADADDAVTELKQGWFNAAYDVALADGRQVVLKIAPPAGAEVLTYERNIMRTEVDTMRLVGENPLIPVPEIYSFDDAHDLCDADYFFMEKLTGDNLDHVKESLPAHTLRQVRLHIGEIIREINPFTGTYFGYPGNPDLRADDWRTAFVAIVESVLDDGLRKHADYGHSYDDLRAAVDRHADALEHVSTPSLVHWDAWDPNFFVRDGHVTGLLDFERALWGDPLMEAQFRPFGDPSTDAMRGYGKTTFTPDEERRSQLYTLHLALVMNTECYYRHYDNDHVYNASTRLLATSMDWLGAH